MTAGPGRDGSSVAPPWSRRRSRSIRATIALLLALGMVAVTPGIGLAERHRVRAAPERWRPTHLYIVEGDTVVWRNSDDRRHDVVAYGGGWRFRRTLQPGDAARRTFDEARSRGRPYTYRCTFHSAIVDGRCEGMCGLIHVFVA